MKHFFSYTLIFCFCLFFFSCNRSLKEENEDLKAQVTNLLKENKQLTLELSEVHN